MTLSMTTNNDFFLAVYNEKEQCVGIFDTYKDLAEARIVGNTATTAFLKQKFYHYIKKNNCKPYITEENGTRFCSMLIYQSPHKKNNDMRFTKKGFTGYSVYKFWEE